MEFSDRIIVENAVENLKEIKEFWKENGIHTMFIPSESNTDQELKNKILREAELSKVKVSLVPNILLSNYFQYDFEYIDTQPVLNPAKLPLDNYTNTFLKRLIDIFLSIFVLVFIGIWLFL